MLGWRSSVHGEANVAFSSINGNNSMALPLARRHELATLLPSVSSNPSMVSASTSWAADNSAWSANLQVVRGPVTAFRKRPGSCEQPPLPTSRDDDDRGRGVDEPLDLTVPKLKVRQHWSGGSIVQVNERSEAGPAVEPTWNYCCASTLCPSDTDLIVTLQTSTSFRPVLTERPLPASLQCRPGEPNPTYRSSWPIPPPYEQDSAASESAFWAETVAVEARRHTHTDPVPSHSREPKVRSPSVQQVQVQLRIPHQNASSSAEHSAAPVPNKIVQFLRASRVRKPQSVIPQPQRPHGVSDPAPGDHNRAAMDDDLRRLTQCQHHLSLSGYYYGNLSWKDSIQLLQPTAVGTFLVRDSSDPRYLYALSIQTDRGPTSVRIHYTDGSFRLDADSQIADRLPTFRSVPDLVDFYVSQWKKCRENGQVWLDNSGQVHSDVVLHKALLKECPSLQHLCRLSWNQLSSESKIRSGLGRSIPHRVQSYLREYPYQY